MMLYKSSSSQAQHTYNVSIERRLVSAFSVFSISFNLKHDWCSTKSSETKLAIVVPNEFTQADASNDRSRPRQRFFKRLPSTENTRFTNKTLRRMVQIQPPPMLSSDSLPPR